MSARTSDGSLPPDLTDPNLRDGETFEERQWRDDQTFTKGVMSMGTTVTIERKPDGVIVIGSGLRPAGHTVGISFAFTPDDPSHPGRNTGSSAKVRDDGTMKVVTDTFELTLKDASDTSAVPAGIVHWWWHDGTDFDEPAIEGDGGSGEFRVP